MSPILISPNSFFLMFYMLVVSIIFISKKEKFFSVEIVFGKHESRPVFQLEQTETNSK